MDSSNERDEIEIDLLELFFVLWRHILIILGVSVVCALCGFLVSKFLIAPTYESTTKIYILNKNDSSSVTYSDVQLGTQLTKDYAELINSRYVIEAVIEDLSLDIEYNALVNKITVDTPSDTRIVSITVSDHDPELAMNIANSVRENASEHIRNVMDIDAVNVVEEANLPTEKASPSCLKWTLIGGLIGFVIVCAVLIVMYLLDDTIKSSEDVEKYLKLSTLALIPMSEDENDRKKKNKHKPGR